MIIFGWSIPLKTMLIIFMYNNNKILLVLNNEPQLHLVDLPFCPYVLVSLSLNIFIFYYISLH